MLSDREAFKVGFISRCIEEGHTTPDQIQGQVKRAMDTVAGIEKRGYLGDIIRGIGGLGSSALAIGVPLALMAPPVLGATAGYAAARATDIDDTDVEEQKRQEIIDELKRQASKIQRLRAKRAPAGGRLAGLELL